MAYKNLQELKKDMHNNRMYSTHFESIYKTIINGLCNQETGIEYKDEFTKLDVTQLRALGFDVQVVKTHGILNSGRNEKLVIKWT